MAAPTEVPPSKLKPLPAQPAKPIRRHDAIDYDGRR